MRTSLTLPRQTKGIGGHHRPYQGRSDDWLTPPDIIKEFGPFDLDPCAGPQPRPWPTAKTMWASPDNNGLPYPWFGRVWLNPPYGPETSLWLKRLMTHGNGIALVFARTETVMFQKFIWEAADAILFLYGRLHFYSPAGDRAAFNSGGPSCLVAYGPKNAAILKRSTRPSAFVPLMPPARSRSAHQG